MLNVTQGVKLKLKSDIPTSTLKLIGQVTIISSSNAITNFPKSGMSVLGIRFTSSFKPDEEIREL